MRSITWNQYLNVTILVFVNVQKVTRLVDTLLSSPLQLMRAVGNSNVKSSCITLEMFLRNEYLVSFRY